MRSLAFAWKKWKLERRLARRLYNLRYVVALESTEPIHGVIKILLTFAPEVPLERREFLTTEVERMVGELWNLCKDNGYKMSKRQIV